ncbi:MAG: hypothetical protein ACREOE_11815, partial [Gemmatimonadales bacterium]
YQQGSWGYRRFGDLDSLGDAYLALIEQLRRLEGAGVAAAVYTQVSDVESEVNGVMTYDRAVVKVPPDAHHSAPVPTSPLPRRGTPPISGSGAPSSSATRRGPHPTSGWPTTTRPRCT